MHFNQFRKAGITEQSSDRFGMNQYTFREMLKQFGSLPLSERYLCKAMMKRRFSFSAMLKQEEPERHFQNLMIKHFEQHGAYSFL
jgi:hypothetical protein